METRSVLRVATRASALAKAQTNWVIARLRDEAPDVDFVVVLVRTEGDIDRKTPLPQMGGRGVFVREVERALLQGEADIAVHSLKDLPTQDRPGVTVASIPVREDPRDALVTREKATVDDLKSGARIATGSIRRQAQLAWHRSDLSFHPIRGNVDTRVKKVTDGAYDATVLALAGLVRTGIKARFLPIPLGIMLPAAGQGALAVQCREDDSYVLDLLKKIDEPRAHEAVSVERALLARLEAGCHAPVGVYCRLQGDRWLLDVSVARPDGSRNVRIRVASPATPGLADRAYQRLADEDAVRIVHETSP